MKDILPRKRDNEFKTEAQRNLVIYVKKNASPLFKRLKSLGWMFLVFMIFFVGLIGFATTQDIDGTNITDGWLQGALFVGIIMFPAIILYIIVIGFKTFWGVIKIANNGAQDPEIAKGMFKRIDGEELSEKDKNIQEIVMRERFGDLKKTLSPYARQQHENYALPARYKSFVFVVALFLVSQIFFKAGLLNPATWSDFFITQTGIFYLFGICLVLGFLWLGANLIYMSFLQGAAYDAGQSMGYHVQWPKPVTTFLKLYGLVILSFFVWHIITLVLGF